MRNCDARTMQRRVEKRMQAARAAQLASIKAENAAEVAAARAKAHTAVVAIYKGPRGYYRYSITVGETVLGSQMLDEPRTIDEVKEIAIAHVKRQFGLDRGDVEFMLDS